jgi:hypothetical protein
MSIKSRLFGKPWQNKDPAIRAKAVAEDKDSDLLADIGRIAEHDESPTVRLAALNRIDTEPFWLDARLRESDDAITRAADAFLFKAVMRGANEALVKERLEWFRRIEDPEFVRRVATHAPDRALRAEALARIDSPGFLGDRVVEEADEALALSLVERIDQRSTLERIEQRLRRRSKRRTAAVAARLRQLLADSGEFDAVSESASELVERAEALARGQFQGDRGAEIRALESLWEEIGGAPGEALERRFRGALEIARRAQQTPPRERRGPETSADAAPDAPAAVANEALAAIVDRLESLKTPESVDTNRAAELLGEFDRAWQSMAHPTAADEALRERAFPILRDLQKRRQQSVAKAPSRPASQAPEAESLDWQAELDAAARLLESGDIVRAQAELRQLRARLDGLKPKQRPREATGRLGRLEGRLREMRNWEHWSNNQHRDELIERVEQLAESGQHPDAIAAALKEARREWQHLEDLEVLPGDKRRHAAPSGQWRRFQAACKQAFGEAKPFFEKRHEVQADNLEQLESFLDRGRAVVADEASDVDTLKGFSKSARLAIRRLDDLPPRSRGKSAARLRELLEALSKRLDAAFEAIEMSKRRLIREAQALEHESDLKTAIDRAKSLQAQWKEAGTGRRRIEQKLWKEFREPIDPLFEKLRGEQDQRREAQEAETAALRELVGQAEGLADCDESELDQAEGRLKALLSQWQEAGRKPDRLTDRLEKAQRALERRLKDRRHAAHRAALEKLEALAEKVQQAWRVRQGGDIPENELAGIEPADEAARSLQSAAADLADPSVDTESLGTRVTENGDRARQILIEMEFLAGLDSPAEDREARMNFQVERLARRMSERGQAPGLNDELGALRNRWYASFPLPDGKHQAMAMRFRKCQNVLESMSGTE